MWRKALALILVFAWASSAAPGTIVRGTKSSGGTAFQEGEIIDPDEVNTDFDTIYTLVNGGIDTDNIEDGSIAAADLASGIFDLTLADDISANLGELMDECRGTNDASCNEFPDRNSGTPSGTADTGAEELMQLRRAIRRAIIGDSAQLNDASGTDADEGAWFDPPLRYGPNLLRNGDFEVYTGAANSAPDGWTLIDTPGTVAQAETEVGEGEGKELNIVADTATEQGIQQTLAGLKASTAYLVTVRAKKATGGCHLETTGAATGDFDDLALTASGTSYDTVAGVIKTDSTPTNIVVKLTLNDGATDDCDFDHAGVFELNSDYVAQPRRAVLYTSSTDQTTSISAAAYTILQDTAGTADMELAVTVPSTNCIIEVDAFASVDGTADASMQMQIHENGSPVGVPAVFSVSTGTDEGAGGSVFYVNTNPTPGTTYTYDVGAFSGSSGFTQGANDISGNGGAALKIVMECGS